MSDPKKALTDLKRKYGVSTSVEKTEETKPEPQAIKPAASVATKTAPKKALDALKEKYISAAHTDRRTSTGRDSGVRSSYADRYTVTSALETSPETADGAQAYERKYQEQKRTEDQRSFAPPTPNSERKALGRAQQLQERVGNAQWQSDPDPLWIHTEQRAERKKKTPYHAFRNNRRLYELWEGDYNAYLAGTLKRRTTDLEDQVQSHLTDKIPGVYDPLHGLMPMLDLEWDAQWLSEEINRINREIEYYSLSGRAGRFEGVDPDGIDPQRDRMFAERDRLMELYEAASKQTEPEKALLWENKQRKQILAAGGEELLDLMKTELEMEEMERQFASYEYYDLQKPAVDWLRANSPQIRELAGSNYDNWKAYVERLVNAELYEEVRASVAENSDTTAGGIVNSLFRFIPSLGRGIGALDLAGQKLVQDITGSNIPLDYKTVAQHPGLIADTIADTVAENISYATGGEGEENVASNTYRGIMKIEDAAASFAADILTGIPVGTAMSAMGNAQKSMIDVHEQGEDDIEAMTKALWTIAADTVKSKTVEYAAPEKPAEIDPLTYQFLLELAQAMI